MKKRLILALPITNGCALSNLGYWLYMVFASRGNGYPIGPTIYYWYIYYPSLLFPTLIILPFLFLLSIVVMVWRELRSASPYFMENPRSGWIALAFVLGCLISISPFLIGSGSSTGELRHQASIKYDGHVYHLAELSRWNKTDDVLYRCDQFGIICTSQFTMDAEERATVLDQLKERR